jgi:hypothetical protein
MPPPRRYKTSFTVGLEHVLNNPTASFINSSKVINEINEKSGLSMTAIMKHIGKRKRSRQEPKEKSDEEKSKERLGKLEAASAAQ